MMTHFDAASSSSAPHLDLGPPSAPVSPQGSTTCAFFEAQWMWSPFLWDLGRGVAPHGCPHFGMRYAKPRSSASIRDIAGANLADGNTLGDPVTQQPPPPYQ